MVAGLKETHTQERVKTTGLTKAMRKQADNALIVFIRLKSPVLFGVTGSIRLRDENGFYIPLTWGGGHVHSPPRKSLGQVGRIKSEKKYRKQFDEYTYKNKL